MALSTAKDVKRALADALKAATYADPQPGIWHSTPNVDHNYHDNLIIGPADNPMRVSQEWGELGRRKRNEAIEIPIRVEVFREGTDEYEAEDRAWALAEAVQTVIDADVTLGLAQVRSELASDIDQSTEVFADGRLARVNLTVSCSAFQRLT